MAQKNLGIVKAIHVGTTEPTNTNMLWFDSNTGINKHKYYNQVLSIWMYLSGVDRVTQSGIVANTTLDDPILAGFIVVAFEILNNTANAVTISIGTSVGGDDILSGYEISASAYENFSLGELFSLSVDSDIYVHSTNWNSADLDISFKVEQSGLI